MKILFFSDIHGNKYVLEPLLEVIKVENVDKVIFCGDVFGYYYYQNEIIDFFRKHNFTCLLGNHDKMFLDIVDGIKDKKALVEKYGSTYEDADVKVSKSNIEYLRTLSAELNIEEDGLKIAVFHGSPEDSLNGRVYPDAVVEKEYVFDYIILGHTHHKLIKKVNNTTIINPGSIGQQRDGRGCSCLILDTVKNEYYYKIVSYDVDQLARDIDKYDSGNEKLKEVLYRKAKSFEE